jgi:hypothetical protein
MAELTHVPIDKLRDVSMRSVESAAVAHSCARARLLCTKFWWRNLG